MHIVQKNKIEALKLCQEKLKELNWSETKITFLRILTFP